MSVDPALTVNELAALAGPSVVRTYMVFDTEGGDNLVARARVNGSPAYPLSTLDVDGTSAGWNDILPNMTVFIGSTLDGFDRGIFRVRAFGTASTLEMMAVGENDSGELAVVSRDTGIQDNDYITVLRRFDMFGVFPRIAYSGIGTNAAIYEDWDKVMADFNKNPPPRINVLINGRPSNYATHVYNNTSATFDITLNLDLWPTSSSATYSIGVPSGVTVNSGSISGSGTTATINVTVPHSADSYTFSFLGVENHGKAFISYRKVWVKSFTYPPLELVRYDSEVWDTTGWQATVTLNTLEDVPPLAMFHIFDMATWNGTSVPTAIDQFSGYAVRRRESTDIGVANVSLDIVGPSYLLDQIGGQSQIMSAVASPLTWQQVSTSLTYLDFIIWWLLAQRVSGMLQMFNYNTFGLSNTEKRMTDWRIDTGTLLSQVQSLAFRYGKGNFGCDPTGEMWLRRYPSLVPSADRSGIPTRITFDETIYKHVDLGCETRPRIRRLRGEAFYSNGTDTNTPVWCDAPQIPGQGQAEEKLEKQVVDEPDEIYELTGNDYQWRNNAYPNGGMSVPKNYAVVKPAQLLREYLSIPAYLRFDRVVYAGYITITKVMRTHNADGTIDNNYEFHAETVGLPATNVPIPIPDPTLYNSPYQSTPFAPLPPYQSPNPNPAGTTEGPRVVPRNGSVGFCGTETNAFLATNVLGTPQYRDITPSDLGDYVIKHGIIVVGTTHAYILASDGTNSAIWHTSNVFATSVTWSKGDDITGVYEEISSPGNAAKVLAYGAGELAINTNADNGELLGVIGDFRDGINPSDNGVYQEAQTFQVTSTGIVTKMTFKLIASHNSPTGTISWSLQTVTAGVPDGGVLASGTVSPTDSATNTITVIGGPTLTSGTSYALVLSSTSAQSSNAYWQWSYSSSNPYPDGTRCYKIDAGAWTAQSGVDFQMTVSFDSGNASVFNSSDYGDTGSVVTVGATPGNPAGFDVQRSGTVSYAAALNKIRKATTLGGSYSDNQTLTSVNAGCIVIPWYTRNSLSALNSGSSPQFIYALTSADGSGNSLYWVVGGTPVDITPSISGNPGLATIPNCITTWKGKYIAAVLSFSGTLHLVTSIDAGATWTDRGAVNAPYIRVRRQSAQPGQLFMAGHILDYSPTFGGSLVSKAKPNSDDLVFYEPVG